MWLVSGRLKAQYNNNEIGLITLNIVVSKSYLIIETLSFYIGKDNFKMTEKFSGPLLTKLLKSKSKDFETLDFSLSDIP